jgi:hypothetical protein
MECRVSQVLGVEDFTARGRLQKSATRVGGFFRRRHTESSG